ncbi:MAG: winged helix-turn-helix domain-containing protein [Thermoplasmata archaeon]
MRKKILKFIEDGYNLDEISDNLDISRPTIDEIIKSLVRTDYLVDYDCDDCSSCPFSCSDLDSNNMDAYVVTEKGKNWIKEK